MPSTGVPVPDSSGQLAINHYRERSAQMDGVPVEFKRIEEIRSGSSASSADADEDISYDKSETVMCGTEPIDGTKIPPSDDIISELDEALMIEKAIDNHLTNKMTTIQENSADVGEMTDPTSLGDDKPDMLLDNKQSIDIQEVKVINKGPGYVALDAQIDGVRYMGVLCASSDQCVDGQNLNVHYLEKSDRQEFIDFCHKKDANVALDQWISMLVCRKFIPGRCQKRPPRANWAKKNKRMVCYSCLCVVPDDESYTMPFSCKCRDKARQRASTSRRRLNLLKPKDRFQVIAQLPPESTIAASDPSHEGELNLKSKAPEKQSPFTSSSDSSKCLIQQPQRREKMPATTAFIKSIQPSRAIPPTHNVQQTTTQPPQIKRLIPSANLLTHRSLMPSQLQYVRNSTGGAIKFKNSLVNVTQGQICRNTSLVDVISPKDGAIKRAISYEQKKPSVASTILAASSAGVGRVSATGVSGSLGVTLKKLPGVNRISSQLPSIMTVSKNLSSATSNNDFLLNNSTSKASTSIGYLSSIVSSGHFHMPGLPPRPKEMTISSLLPSSNKQSQQFQTQSHSHSHPPLELRKSLEPGSTIIQATPLLSTHNSWCVVHRNEKNPLQMTILKLPSPTEKLPTLEEAQTIDEKIGLINKQSSQSEQQLSSNSLDAIIPNPAAFNKDHQQVPKHSTNCSSISQLISSGKAISESIQTPMSKRTSLVSTIKRFANANITKQTQQKDVVNKKVFKFLPVEERMKATPTSFSSVGTPLNFARSLPSSSFAYQPVVKTTPDTSISSIKSQHTPLPLRFNGKRMSEESQMHIKNKSPKGAGISTSSAVLSTTKDDEPAGKKSKIEFSSSKSDKGLENVVKIEAAETNELGGENTTLEPIPETSGLGKSKPLPTLFREGNVVWAKANQLPIWPGIIVEAYAEQGIVVVSWCGEKTYSEVPLDKVESFLDSLVHRFPPTHNKLNRNKKFCMAVAEAIKSGKFTNEELSGRISTAMASFLATKYGRDLTGLNTIEKSKVGRRMSGTPGTPKNIQHSINPYVVSTLPQINTTGIKEQCGQNETLEEGEIVDNEQQDTVGNIISDDITIHDTETSSKEVSCALSKSNSPEPEQVERIVQSKNGNDRPQEILLEDIGHPRNECANSPVKPDETSNGSEGQSTDLQPLHPTQSESEEQSTGLQPTQSESSEAQGSDNHELVANESQIDNDEEDLEDTDLRLLYLDSSLTIGTQPDTTAPADTTATIAGTGDDSDDGDEKNLTIDLEEEEE